MARGVDPARLVEHDDAAAGRGSRVRACSAVARARAGRAGSAPRPREARPWPAERAEARAREPDRAMELREVEGGRRLPDAPGRLRHDAQRNAASGELACAARATCRGCTRRTSPCARGRSSASSALTIAPPPLVEPPSETSAPVRRGVVRPDQHAAAGAGRAGSRRRARRSMRVSVVTAIASLRVEAAGNVARAFQAAACARASGSRRRCPRSPGNDRAASRRTVAAAARRAAAGAGAAAPRGEARRRCGWCGRLGGPSRRRSRRGRHLAGRQVDVEGERFGPRGGASRRSRPSTRTITRRAPGAARPLDDAVRRLERHGPLDRRRLSAEAAAIGHGRTVAFALGMPILAHLDLDAFFAAVEELEDPVAADDAPRRRRRPARARCRRDGELRRAPLRDPLGDELRRGAPPVPGDDLRPPAPRALPPVLAGGLGGDRGGRAARRADRDRRGLPRPRQCRPDSFAGARAGSPRRCRSRCGARPRSRARSVSRPRRSSARSPPIGASRVGSRSCRPVARRDSSPRSRPASCPGVGPQAEERLAAAGVATLGRSRR